MRTAEADRHAASRAAVVLDSTPVEPSLLGGKGAALARLVVWGVPVPPTAVVTTDAYRRFARQPAVTDLLARLDQGRHVGSDEIDAVFAAASFDPADAASIVAVAREIAAGRHLAVRSSATVEDLDRSSFAGQYRSVLDVDPADDRAVLDAVRAVFASLWHPAPRSYRASFGIPDEQVAMAAVLMQMVPALRAGVAFTVDPAGDGTLARVETVSGLGEALVSGRTTPEVTVLPRQDGEAGPVVGVAPEVESALSLAMDIEARSGRPQDVEWAWDGVSVWIVQARPITVTEAQDGDGFDDPAETIDGLDLTTAGIGEMLPGVLPPLVWAVSSHLVEEAFRRLLDDLAVLPADLVDERAVVRRIEGRAAMDFGRVQAMAGALPGSAADDLEAEYFGSRRTGRRAGSTAPSLGRFRSVAHDLRVLRSRHRYALDATMLTEAAPAIVAEASDLSISSDRQLAVREHRLIDLAGRGTAAELGVAADAAATFRRLQVMLARHVGLDEAGRLAARAVLGIGVSAPLGPGSSAAVFAGPMWEELGRVPPVAPAEPSAEEEELAFRQRIQEVRSVLGESPRWHDESLLARLRMRAIRRLAREAAVRLRLRERAKTALLAIGGEVRRVHLEVGRRLSDRGLLGDPSEVDLLSPREMWAMLEGRGAVTPDVVNHRRRWRRRYEQDGPLPPRFVGRPERALAVGTAGSRIEGWAASPGRFRGRAVVLRSPDEELPPDSVLVAEATDPSWSPVFLAAGALVLDRGGPLSHAAILARELGLPAVLNVPGATALLAGREVTVDGDAGVVFVHDPERPEPLTDLSASDGERSR